MNIFEPEDSQIEFIEKPTISNVKTIYVVKRTFWKNQMPIYSKLIAASTKLERAMDYAKRWVEFIEKYGDSIFSNRDQDIKVIKGKMLYEAKDLDSDESLIFCVHEVPVLVDRTE